MRTATPLSLTLADFAVRLIPPDTCWATTDNARTTKPKNKFPILTLEVQTSTKCEPASVGRAADASEVRGVDVGVGVVEDRVIHHIHDVRPEFEFPFFID